MRLTLSAALSLALIAAPAGAQGPCDILAEAINARFEAGTPVGLVTDALAHGTLQGSPVAFPKRRDSAIPHREAPVNPRSNRFEYAIPHLSGALLVTYWDGTANCQALEFHRVRNGRPQFVRDSGVDKLGGACLDAEIRPVGIGGKPYLLDVPARPGQSPEEGDEERVVLHALTRNGVAAQGGCAVALGMGPRARIEDAQPTDAASVQARRAAMAALEAAMPDLLYAYQYRFVPGAGPVFDDLPEAALRWNGGDRLDVQFRVAQSTYLVRLEEGARDRDELAVRLSRLWPELGGRERELATFRYARSRAFVRALSRQADLR